MREIELKFQVPAAARDRLHRAVATKTVRALPLAAAYVDTADDRLARAGFALRLRREGTRWVQTLKGRGDGLMDRLEHEVELPDTDAAPVLDPARHAGTPAGDALARLLADGAPLVERYRTEVVRLARRVRSQGALVEIALDEGRIVAGANVASVCEIEFELLSGPPAGLLALAERWVARHGLWLDVRTKAERGHRLALGLERVPAVRAEAPEFAPGTLSTQAFGLMLHAALRQVLPNAAEIASGSGEADTLHQLRVGLRRLRSVLKVFAAWSPDEASASALDEALAAPFAALGASRDAEVAAALLAPLAAAGAPPLAWPRDDGAPAPADVVAAPDFTRTMLRTMALALVALHTPGPALGRAGAAQLAADWRRVRREARRFARLDAEQRHRLRKRLKRLRYATEFLLPTLRPRRARAALKALRAALEALGQANDHAVARAALAARAAADPADAAVAFALGWLVGREDAVLAGAAAALAPLDEVRRFWR
ncbi:CYTH domain-containing protein [Rubrivivax gelatinosus]|uniref:Inorganic triphosphatase YgiF n=1 Tax=Rubrivivax gelatinosus TaxID=28068 RepID=A0A4R2M6Y2_RUBGE|nr:CYTH domain-containing protein [Rubrivivax gelatinosus]MBK1688406.1 hypothetical protein [Rubrivivax gelatinosus]TCP01861.1 inorganic triphosphatase YgiF [Rubrivivax gelatinosus]